MRRLDGPACQWPDSTMKSYLSLFLSMTLFSVHLDNILRAQQPAPTIIEMITGDDLTVRARAQKQLLNERTKLIQSLMAQIKKDAQSAKNVWKVRDMMNVLGDIHASESIPVLLQFAGYPHTSPDAGRVEPDPRPSFAIGFFDESMPATDALVKIGEPAIGPIVDKLTRTNSKMERISLATALRRIDSPFGRSRLVDAATGAKGDEQTSGLNEAIRIYDAWTPTSKRVKEIQEHFNALELQKSGK